MTKLNDSNSNNPSNSSGSSNKHSHEPPHAHEPDLPKTPKPRNSHSNTLSQDNLLKKMVDAHTPESAGGSLSGKSIPSTPGGMSLNTFEQLMKKNEQSPIDLMPLSKHNKSLTGSQESGLDFSMNKKSNHNPAGMGGGGGGGVGGMMGGISVKTPITINNEPIEVSDDSDETNQPPPPPPKTQHQTHNAPPPPVSTSNMGGHLSNQQQSHSSFNMDDMFVANTNNNPTHLLGKSMESDLSSKELKKLKKQVKKSSSSITAATLMNNDKSDVNTVTATSAASTGVGKLAGGADLIPLTSTGMAYSSKNIPYNSLTANANPSFSVHKTDFTGNTPTSSSATTASSASVFDNLTITAAMPSSSGNPSSSSSVFDLQKKRKEHKKLKKLKELKEGKIKKKKDKKDKNKEKEKVKKYLLGETQSSPTKEKETITTNQVIDLVPSTPAVTAPVTVNPVSITPHSSSSGSSMEKEKIKDKDLIKKLKKEKKKEKQRTAMEDLTTHSLAGMPQTSSVTNAPSAHKDNAPVASSSGLLSVDTDLPKKQKLSPALSIITNEHKESTSLATSSAAPSPSLVPKLTLKLGSTHSPTPPRDDSHKTSSSKVIETNTSSTQQTPATAVNATPPREPPREPSPELARISPLVTRPPKHKLNTSKFSPLK